MANPERVGPAPSLDALEVMVAAQADNPEWYGMYPEDDSETVWWADFEGDPAGEPDDTEDSPLYDSPVMGLFDPAMMLLDIAEDDPGMDEDVPDYPDDDVIVEDISVAVVSGNMWLDTGVVARSGLRLECLCECISSTGDNQAPFGGRNTLAGQAAYLALFAMSASGSQFRFDYGASVGGFKGKAWLPGSQVLLVRDDNVSYVDGVTYESVAKQTFNTGQNIYLFNVNTNGTPSFATRMRCWYFKIWDESRNLIREFVPIRAGETMGTVTALVDGMYDTMTDAFYQIKGTGSYRVDAVSVIPPEEDEPLDLSDPENALYPPEPDLGDEDGGIADWVYEQEDEEVPDDALITSNDDEERDIIRGY